MHRLIFAAVFSFLSFAAVFGQSAAPKVQSMSDAQTEFQALLSRSGQKTAFLEFLADDAVVFQPDAVNGKHYWAGANTEPDHRVSREMLYFDTASNGMVGYTTGKWIRYPKGTDAPSEQGHFVTVWAKRQGGQFRIVIDMTTTEDRGLPEGGTDRVPDKSKSDPNKRGWSAADPSMNFLKSAMSGGRLGGAYGIYGADEMRLLREGDRPIVGKKRVVEETGNYRSINYPERVVLNESADMAYVWNKCEYSDSDEGVERGNCLHIWKLRDNRWNITLGVLSRVRNIKKPELKLRQKATAQE